MTDADSDRFPSDLPDRRLSPEAARREVAALENVEYGSVLSVTECDDGERVESLLVGTADTGRWRVLWRDGWHAERLSP